MSWRNFNPTTSLCLTSPLVFWIPRFFFAFAATMETMVKEGFWRQDNLNALQVAATPKQLLTWLGVETHWCDFRIWKNHTFRVATPCGSLPLLYSISINALQGQGDLRVLGFTLPEGKSKVTIPIEIHNNLIVMPVVINGNCPWNLFWHRCARPSSQKNRTAIFCFAILAPIPPLWGWASNMLSQLILPTT